MRCAGLGERVYRRRLEQSDQTPRFVSAGQVICRGQDRTRRSRGTHGLRCVILAHILDPYSDDHTVAILFLAMPYESRLPRSTAPCVDYPGSARGLSVNVTISSHAALGVRRGWW